MTPVVCVSVRVCVFLGQRDMRTNTLKCEVPVPRVTTILEAAASRNSTPIPAAAQ